MTFDLVAFRAKLAALTSLLPVVGELVQTAHALAPAAAGLTKAGLVVDMVIAAEPALAEFAASLSPIITRVVAMYRSAGTLPPATPAA
jgi:hypothetical protein